MLYPAVPVDLENLVKGLGVGFLRVTDPNDLKVTRQAFEDALKHDGVAVVITRRPCALLDVRKSRKEGHPPPVYRVDQTMCIRCHTCIRYGCPAIFKDTEHKDKDEKGKIPAQIDDTQCLGCGVCAELCPKGAIKVAEGVKE